MSFIPKQNSVGPRFPIAPMVDVMFLLLVFFVTTSSFRDEEQLVDIELPSAQASKQPEARRTEVVVNVLADGAIMVGTQSFDPRALRELLVQVLRSYPEEHVIIRGDASVAYQRIVTVRDVARSAGARHVSEAVVKPASSVTGG